MCTTIAELSKCLCLYAISLQKYFGIICCSLAEVNVPARNQMFTASRNLILTTEANWKKQQNDCRNTLIICACLP
jgi:hypothetical protein